MEMEIKNSVNMDSIKNIDHIAIPLGIDQTLYVRADHSDVLESIVQNQLAVQLGLNMHAKSSEKLVRLVTDALCQLAQEEIAFADDIDELIKRSPAALH